MRLVLESIGEGKLKPDQLNITFTIISKNIEKEFCMETLINKIGKLTNDLLELGVEQSNIELVSYNMKDVQKQIKHKNKKEETIEYKFDHYFGVAYLNMISPMDFELLDKINTLCENLDEEYNLEGLTSSINVSYDCKYTLSDKSKTEIETLAVNNALDKMRNQAEEINEHLKLNGVKLKEVNFVEAPLSSNNDKMSMTKFRGVGSINSTDNTYQIADLEKILNLKEIKKNVKVYSEWNLIE